MLKIETTEHDRIRQPKKCECDHFSSKKTNHVEAPDFPSRADSHANRTLTSQQAGESAESLGVKADLYSLLFGDDDLTLSALARAIAYAERRDRLPVWRAFVLRRVRS